MKMTPLKNALRVTLLPIALVATIMLNGCSSLLPKPAPQPTFYALDSAHRPQARTPSATLRVPPATQQILVPARTNTLPVLSINPPHAAAGFDSQRIIYMRKNHQLEYFAQSEWIDTPARMIAPLLIEAIETSPEQGFSAVVATPTTAVSDMRLDTEILRLQQTFSTSPSQVRFTVRTYLVDNATRKVLASREFDATVPAATDDPYGGVVAANTAVQRVLAQVALVAHETGRNWHIAKTLALSQPSATPR